MSQARGTALHRRLIALANEMLKPLGCDLEVRLNCRGSHQKMTVILPDKRNTVALGLAGSPRSPEFALDKFRQRLNRLIRDYGLQPAAATVS